MLVHSGPVGTMIKAASVREQGRTVCSITMGMSGGALRARHVCNPRVRWHNDNALLK